jgi:hypothetical protein
MIVAQPRAKRGSQKWIQDIVNACPELLNFHIQEKIKSLSGREICWKSPQKGKNFAEYRDSDFLKEIGLEQLTEELNQFWPKNGPQWDALGKTKDDKGFILVEAKANVPEITSSCSAKDRKSLTIISERLAETQRWLKCRNPQIDWKYGFYQYANRLAHLYFLKEKAQKEAYLVFLYFVDDSTHIPTSLDAWNSALKLQKQLMGLSSRILSDKVIELFINTYEIKSFLPLTTYHLPLATYHWLLTT